MSSQSDSHTADIEQAATPVTDAPAPFNKPTADLILRSSDGMDFRVRKAILAEASPLFEDMFTLPPPPISDDMPSGPPIIDMSEDNRTLEGLLRLCYPVSEMPLQTLDSASALLEVAKKYTLDGALHFLSQRLMSFVDTVPVQVYALAVRYQLQDETIQAAAKASLALNVSYNEMKRIVDFRHISASALLSLLDYRDRCAAATTGIFEDYRWIDFQRWCWLKCSSCHATVAFEFAGGRRAPRTWWTQFMLLCRGLVQGRPSGKALAHRSCVEVALKDASKCSFCNQHAQLDLGEFVECLMAKVDEAVAQVDFELVV